MARESQAVFIPRQQDNSSDADFALTCPARVGIYWGLRMKMSTILDHTDDFRHMAYVRMAARYNS